MLKYLESEYLQETHTDLKESCKMLFNFSFSVALFALLYYLVILWYCPFTILEIVTVEIINNVLSRTLIKSNKTTRFVRFS